MECEGTAVSLYDAYKIRKVAKMIELHVHLDGSLRPATVMELADQQGILLPTRDLQVLTDDYLQVPESCVDLVECLKRFDLPIKVLGTPQAIRRVTYELVEDLAGEGYEYAEIRFAPQYARFTGYSQQEFVEAARDGLKEALAKYPAMKASLILCCMRGDDNREENIETIRMTARHLDSGICATDLAGAESLFPTEMFADVFALAKKLDIPYTIHAGESAGRVSGPDSIRSALQMGAQRLGHGVLAIQDPVLVKELATRKIALEVSYTSNVQTKAFPTAAEHSLRRLYEAGVHVTLNTDNRTVSNVNLKKEIIRVKQAFGFTDQDIAVMQQYAREAAFTRW